MTRVEKYREYRKEILNSFYADKKVTKKKQSSDLVSRATLNQDATNSLSYDEVLEVYQIYDKGDDETKKKNRLSKAQKHYRIFIIVCLTIIALLASGMVIVGIKLFGGNL